MAKPPPRADFRGGFATQFRRPKRNFVAPPRNSPREARWRHPYFHPYSAVVSDIGPPSRCSIFEARLPERDKLADTMRRAASSP